MDDTNREELIGPPSDSDAPSVCQVIIPMPGSHAYGHSHRGHDNAVAQILPAVLPLDEGDKHRLLLDLASCSALDGCFGDAHNLEVWMRDSDLVARRFHKAWCLIRTD